MDRLTLIAIALLALWPSSSWAEPEVTPLDSPTMDAGPYRGTVLTIDAAPSSTPSMPTPEDVIDSTVPEETQQEISGVLSQIVAAARAGHWRLVASGLLILTMLLLARFRQHDWLEWAFGGSRGGSILIGVLGILGGLASAIATDAPLDWRLLLGGLAVTWTAVGGVVWLRSLVAPPEA